MELYEEMLGPLLRGQTVRLVVEGLDLQKVMEDTCYQALRDILAILRSSDLPDPECFRRIEEIAAVYERLGAGTGRHDFG